MADALVDVVALCPALGKVTIVDPGPARNEETTQTSLALSARASLETARGALWPGAASRGASPWT